MKNVCRPVKTVIIISREVRMVDNLSPLHASTAGVTSSSVVALVEMRRVSSCLIKFARGAVAKSFDLLISDVAVVIGRGARRSA